MFNLRRYFSLASAVAIITVTTILGVLFDRHSMDELVRSSESDNVTLARAFANTIWPRFSPYVMSVSGTDRDTLRARSETQEIHDALTMLTWGLPVLKVKIYNLNGLTVYSSQPSQIGANKSGNLGYLKSARDGLPASKLSHRDTFSTFLGEVQDRDIFESYIPIWGRDGAVEGVFELYTDVTPLIAEVRHSSIKLMIGLLLILGLLYGVLFLIVHRADRVLKKQYADLRSTEERIKTKNVALEHEAAKRERAEAALREAHDSLEQRVMERTDALEETNQRLNLEVTEREQVERKLRNALAETEAANRAKSDFLATMSHELRTPLNAIIGFSQTIKDETFGPVGTVRYRDYSVDIYESGQHLLGLINDILDLSKVESGEDELCEDDIEILDVARSVLMLVKGRAHKDGVVLETDLAEQLPMLRADERKLKQILVNLLSNAIKFTDAGGRVFLKISLPNDGGHVFQVIDTGIGIASEDISMAFSRFGQVDGSLARKYEGTGLGLPLTKLLVELHGGTLDLRSEVGVGTTVTVRFPAERIVALLDNSDSLDVEDRAAS